LPARAALDNYLKRPTIATDKPAMGHRRHRFNDSMRGGVMICMALAACLLTFGCKHDSRISFREFGELQKRSETRDSIPPPSTPSASAVSPSSAVDEGIRPYRVGPGDMLVVTVAGYELNIPSPVRTRVSRDGDLLLPTVGAVRVTGLELEDVERAIRKAFVPTVVKDLVVTVDVENFHATHVLVRGAVSAPGLIPLRRTESNLLFAIASAGGVSQAASGRATLRRVGHPMGDQTFDLTHPPELDRALAAQPLEDGDIIEVEAAEPNTVYVGGLVQAPGPQTYPSGVRLTYMQVLAAAGGPRMDLRTKWGTLVRRMPDGQDVQVKLDLNRLASGHDENFRMAGGDILWIPHTTSTRVQEWVNRNIFFRAGASANVSYNVTGSEYLNRRGDQGGGVNNLENSFDPYGFLRRNAILQSIPTSGR
jgi:protein involved in polysaccharide export with SLBB domain